jgi:hypothetical protein
MKISYRTIAAVLFAVSLFIAPTAFAGDFLESHDFQNGNSAVNWGNGEVTAMGIGIPPDSVRSAAQARAMARRAAVVTARRNLLETIKGVKIESETTVNMGMVESEITKSFVEGFVKGSKILSLQENPDGSIEVTVGINMRGEFTNKVLSSTVYQQTPTEAPTMKEKMPTTEETVAMKEPEMAVEVEKEEMVAKSSEYTGIIFDASKLSPTQPSLSPKVLDMDGNEVYGSSVASREYVIKRGMAGYVDNVQEASSFELVEGNPYIVRGVQRRNSTTIIITNEDAEKIREINKNSGLLEQCKVVIVL